MARIQLASLGTGVAQSANGVVVPNAPGTIYAHNTFNGVTVYADEAGANPNTTGQFTTDTFGRIPGWIDLGQTIDITIPPAPTITVDVDFAADVTAETARALATEAQLVPLAQKGANNGVGSLDSSGRQPTGQASLATVTVSSGTPTAGQVPVFTGTGNQTTPGVAGSSFSIDVTQPPYNAKADSGVTDNTNAFRAAVAAIVAKGGGEIEVPVKAGDGWYGFATPNTLDLTHVVGLSIVGAGVGAGGAMPELRYTAATGGLILGWSCTGITLQDVKISCSGYTGGVGDLVAFDNSATSPNDCNSIRLIRVSFQSIASTAGNCLLRWNHTINSSVEYCDFFCGAGNYGIVYGNNAASPLPNQTNQYVVISRVSCCQFTLGATAQIYVKAIDSESNTISGCTFEPIIGGVAAAIVGDSDLTVIDNIEGCWFGDAGAGGTWIYNIGAKRISNCRFFDTGGFGGASMALKANVVLVEGCHLAGSNSSCVFNTTGAFGNVGYILVGNEFANNSSTALFGGFTPSSLTMVGNFGNGIAPMQGPNPPTAIFPVVAGLVGAAVVATGLPGATAAGRYVGVTVSGAPVSGTFNKGDWVTDQAGSRWTCTTAGSPGTWTREPGGSSGGQGSPTFQAGNLGSTSTLDLSAHPAGLIGTLNANCALTVSNLGSGGAQALLLLSQDATGNRTLSINSSVISIPTAANAKFALQLDYDGTNLNAVLLGGGNGITSVTASDGSIVVGGTANAPTLVTGTVDAIASAHPPAAAWSNNSKKITSLANGSGAQDAAAFGQIASALALYTTTIENVNVVATSGSTQTIPDVTSDTASRIVLSAACTLTFPTATAGKSFLLALVQDGTGSRTVTWPGSVKWPGGIAPTLTTTASKVDLFSFVCLDGSNWLGLPVGQNF